LVPNFAVEVKNAHPASKSSWLSICNRHQDLLKPWAFGLLTYESNDQEARALKPFKVLTF
jgi:hypothetical protein